MENGKWQMVEIYEPKIRVYCVNIQANSSSPVSVSDASGAACELLEWHLTQFRPTVFFLLILGFLFIFHSFLKLVVVVVVLVVALFGLVLSREFKLKERVVPTGAYSQIPEFVSKLHIKLN